MAYRLAIAISGAVSLGSYEAGVMFEVIRAIGAHNRAVAAEPERRIVIDVLTGASAGGMTAVILAQKLLFDGASLDDPAANPLCRPWVQIADRLLDHLYAGRGSGEVALSGGGSPGEPTREADFARLKQQFSEGVQSLLAEKKEPSVEAWIKAVQVLELSGRLGQKDVMQVYTITAGDDELAGGQGGGARALPLTQFTLPPDLPEGGEALGRATLADVDKEVRRDLRERFSDRIERLLEQAKVCWLIRKPLMWFFVNGKLKKLLALD
jgi:hypothetical protein